MCSPFFCELNLLYDEAQHTDEVRECYAVALIVHHVKQELCKYAKKGASRPSLDITLSFGSLPDYYVFTPPRHITLKFPDLEKARQELAKDTPEIVWAVIDLHSTPGLCECTYCFRYGMSATWTWTKCDPDLT